MTDNAELFAALVKFQAAAQNVTKGEEARIQSSKGSFSYKYADIAAVIEAVKAPLAEQGLCYLQILTNVEGRPALRTVLAHTSGQSIEGVVPLMGSLDDPKAFGGVVTYYRRYHLLGILGLATDDDDGQSAVPAKPSGHAQRDYDRQRESPQTANGNAPGPSQRVTGDEDMTWTDLYGLTRPMGYANRAAIEAKLGRSIAEWTPAQVFAALKDGDLPQPSAPPRSARGQVRYPLTPKQLETIRGTMPRKGMDIQGWDGWARYVLDLEESVLPEDLSKQEASKIIEELFAMPDNKEMQAIIESSGGVMAHGR